MLICPGPAAKSSHQAVRDTLDVVSGKWKLAILAVLLHETQRFQELSRRLGISPLPRPNRRIRHLLLALPTPAACFTLF
ncbi:MAG: transcriptional regulator [Hymenobacter sp.]|nr:MAG: transcriptional regulator [Hymenobacter sp.]